MRKTLIVFAFVLLCSSFAGAQSTESVCDGEQGAAYGLCNAFCEAMECDSDDPQASETACNKVQSKFEQVTGHQPPCLQPALSCVCNEGLPGFLAVATSGAPTCFISGDRFILSTLDGIVVADATEGLCSVNDDSGIQRNLSITPAEGAECVAFLRSLAAAAGVTCQE